LNKDLENLRKKNQTEILDINSPFSQTKTQWKGHSSRLEQVKDRISALEDKSRNFKKDREILDKRLKSCERNMQELSDSIKRPNL
jgi:chromosome segregation ATPase